MLVLEYGIECDLSADGNTKIVDGEIEITSEIFLRELEKKIHNGIVRASVAVEDPEWLTLETDDAFADKDLWEDLVCLEVQLSESEDQTLLR